MRLTKLTDYAIVLLTYFSRGADPCVWSARDLADEARLSAPVVSKILKGLARAGLLVSQRGSRGGYRLARPARDISIADVVQAVEGPLAVAECVEGAGICQHERDCPVRGNWHGINAQIREVLSRVPLSEIKHHPVHPAKLPPQATAVAPTGRRRPAERT